jgi:hypothetical protein
MYLYSAVMLFNSEEVFYTILERNSYFKHIPEWYKVLSLPKIYN